MLALWTALALGAPVSKSDADHDRLAGFVVGATLPELTSGEVEVAGEAGRYMIESCDGRIREITFYVFVLDDITVTSLPWMRFATSPVVAATELTKVFVQAHEAMGWSRGTPQPLGQTGGFIPVTKGRLTRTIAMECGDSDGRSCLARISTEKQLCTSGL